MPWTLSEPIADTIISELSANLPAKLDALEAALTPALTLPDVAVFSHGERSEVGKFPAIAVTPTRVHATFEKGGSATFVNRLTITIWVSGGQDEVELMRLLERYVRAVAEVLVERDNAGAFPDVELLVEEEDWDYSPLQPGSGGQQYMRVATMPITAWKAEVL